jgi:ADP-ribosylglycohydrolase
MTGGGPFQVRPGQVTDDTQMACCLAASLRANGRFDLDDVARRYVEWSKHAFDVGAQTRQALAKVAAGLSPRRSGLEVWLRAGRHPAGNGSLMRTVPIGIFFAGDPDARVALRLAFWELLHAPSFEAGLIDVVNRGSDADTNGAIASALLGAFHGERAIPRRWRVPVLEALEDDPPGPLRDLYHPRRLLDLVGP